MLVSNFIPSVFLLLSSTGGGGRTEGEGEGGKDTLYYAETITAQTSAFRAKQVD